MGMVVPAFMSLKVVPVIVLGSPSVAVGLASIASEKVAVTLAPGAISIAPLAGLVLLTLGAWVSETQPTTVKDASAVLGVPVKLLAVLVNEPHSVVVATMVSVKGAVGVKSRMPGHVTVFPLVVHWMSGSLSSTESTAKPDGSWSTREEVSRQRGLLTHRCVMVKVICSPTLTVLGVATLSRQKFVLQVGGVSCAWAGLPIPNSIAPPTKSKATAAATTNAASILLIATSCISLPFLSGQRARLVSPAQLINEVKCEGLQCLVQLPRILLLGKLVKC